MEVGAIAVLGIAGPQGISASPTGSGLVVAHGREQVVVDRFGFDNGPNLVARHLLGQGLDLAIDRNKLVRLDQSGHRRRHDTGLAILALELRKVAQRVLAAGHFEYSRRVTSYSSVN